MNRHPRRVFLASVIGSASSLAVASAQKREPDGDSGVHSKGSRCRVLPLPDYQSAVECGGREVLRWHFGAHYPRPFFYPFVGPSGVSLTRMGHPGAPDHDHHRSIWFAHRDVAGADFWSDNTENRIRQKQWLCYEEGDDQATMALRLGWYAGTPAREVMEQTLVAILRPLAHGEQTLELQSTFVPTNDAVRLGQTNFGFLAVRVARSISEHFGGGRLSDSQGRESERQSLASARAGWTTRVLSVTQPWKESLISITRTIRVFPASGMSAKTAGWGPHFAWTQSGRWSLGNRCGSDISFMRIKEVLTVPGQPASRRSLPVLRFLP